MQCSFIVYGSDFQTGILHLPELESVKHLTFHQYLAEGHFWSFEFVGSSLPQTFHIS